ncbi:unnamed protein product [Spodoptera exigua]|nr:unnamed protein product [Spodoptera exigua]
MAYNYRRLEAGGELINIVCAAAAVPAATLHAHRHRVASINMCTVPALKALEIASRKNCKTIRSNESVSRTLEVPREEKVVQTIFSTHRELNSLAPKMTAEIAFLNANESKQENRRINNLAKESQLFAGRRRRASCLSDKN